MTKNTIVGDSSPLIALAIIGQLELSVKMYQRDVIPEKVWEQFWWISEDIKNRNARQIANSFAFLDVLTAAGIEPELSITMKNDDQGDQQVIQCRMIIVLHDSSDLCQRSQSPIRHMSQYDLNFRHKF